MSTENPTEPLDLDAIEARHGSEFYCGGDATVVLALVAEVRRLRRADRALDALRPMMQALDALDAAAEGLHVGVSAALRTLTVDA